MLFWLSMAVIAGGSIAVTNAIATREYESQELATASVDFNRRFRGIGARRRCRAEATGSRRTSTGFRTATSSSSARTARISWADRCRKRPRIGSLSLNMKR